MDIPQGEPALLLILAGDLSLHHWQRLLGWLPAAPASLSEGHLLPRLAVASLALALPAGLFWLARLVVPKQRLLQGLYGLLPLVWALLLARHLPLGMGEAGMLLPVSASAWAPQWSTALPAWSADHHVIAFCQSAVLLVGWLGAVVLLRRQFATQRASWLGSSGLALALAMVGRWLVAI
jgi:hypothetical protein